jgi:hypothetical protein
MEALMEKTETEARENNPELPRPIVLKSEDLASVAVAGAALAQVARPGGPIIAGGLPAAGVGIAA